MDTTNAPTTTIPVPIRPALVAWLRSIPLERAANARAEAARLRRTALDTCLADPEWAAAILLGADHCDAMAAIEEKAAARWGGE